MRIALISPYSVGPARGNITTVRRIAGGYTASGAEAACFPLDTIPPGELGERVRQFAPHAIHGFHAGLCGETACSLAARLGIPCVITITGSDIYDPRHRLSAATAFSMERADSLVCFHNLVAEEVAGAFPGCRDRISIIPQGVAPLPIEPGGWPAFPPGSFTLLLPAALRPVKNVTFPLRALVPLVRDTPDLHLVLAGGEIEPEYTATVRHALSAAPFAEWLGEVPRRLMGNLYLAADLVLNCSDFEAAPNTLLEAMAMGRGVLAADIPGNRTLIRHGETGWLYSSEEQFRELVVLLAGNRELLRETGERARWEILADFSPRQESIRYLELFERLLDQGTPLARR